MTANEILDEIEDYVQQCREESETDLRTILYKIKEIREKAQGEEIA